MAVKPMTIAEYHAMIATGELGKRDSVELLEGWLVSKKPKKPEICTCTSLICDLLRPLVPSGYELWEVVAITTSDSEPEPSAAIIRDPIERFTQRHPQPDEAVLVVETSNGTLAADRHLKLRVYARASITPYWIVNVRDGCIEVYTQPSGPAEQPDYRQLQVFGLNDEVPLMIDGIQAGRVPVRGVVGPYFKAM